VQVSGCLGTNTGFDGVSYQPVWPDGKPNHPTAVQFTSPRTGHAFDHNFKRVAFEANLPRIEAPDFGGTCNGRTGQGCTRIPKTDDGGAPADFYPFFSTQQHGEQCVWALGNVNPGVTTNDFGKNAQFGDLLFLTFLRFGGHGATVLATDDYRQVLSTNPCTAELEGDTDQDGGDED